MIDFLRTAFSSQDSIDKIVNVWQSSYNKATQTTTRTEPFAGIVYAYAISHGLTRPVFPHLVWSEDNSNWVDGGGTLPNGNSAIAISDSTNIYIITTSNSGTMYYKILGAWIDNYDGSNPLVPELSNGTNKAIFDSRANYQKIYSQGVDTYSAGTFGSEYIVSIAHPLGYIPNAKAWFEPILGEVWPLIAGGATNPFLYSFSQDEAYMTITSSFVNINVIRYSNASRRVWYKIYRDA